MRLPRLVGSVGEHADTTLRAFAKFLAPGSDKDPAVRLRRALRLSALRKELMAVFVKNFHYVVTTKHRCIASALLKEQHAGASEILREPYAIPEDVGAFHAVDMDGHDVLNGLAD